MENVKATRAELIRVKSSIKLARAGHSLLKRKRDSLIMEFFQLLKRAKTVRAELEAAYKRSLQKVNAARVLEGDLRVSSTALAVRESAAVEVSSKNILGVQVPHVTGRPGKAEHLLFSSVAITDAAASYESLLDRIIAAAELEPSVRKLLVEIEKTKRRVNALEFEVIPKLEQQRNAIALRLDEIERDNFYRLKLSKQRISQAA